MAEQIGNEIASYDPDKSIDNLPRITLLHRKSDNGTISLKVNSQHNAGYIGQRLQLSKNKWETIDATNNNQTRLRGDPGA